MSKRFLEKAVVFAVILLTSFLMIAKNTHGLVAMRV